MEGPALVGDGLLRILMVNDGDGMSCVVSDILMSSIARTKIGGFGDAL